MLRYIPTSCELFKYSKHAFCLQAAVVTRKTYCACIVLCCIVCLCYSTMELCSFLSIQIVDGLAVVVVVAVGSFLGKPVLYFVLIST